MYRLRTVSVGLVMLALTPAVAGAQGLLRVTPKVGAYFQSESVHQIDDGALEVQRSGESTFAFGANVDVGIPASPLDLRGDVMVASGAAVSTQGFEGDATGDADLLGVSASLVFRPLSFLPLVDPYLLGGGGFTSTSYSGGFDAPDERDFALHAGIGTDVVLGGVRLQVEATDYISSLGGGGDTLHNVFGTVGLGLTVF